MSEFFVMDGSVRYVFAPPPDRSKVCGTASISSSRPGPPEPATRGRPAPCLSKTLPLMHYAERDGVACD